MKKTIAPVSFFFGADNKAKYCSLFPDVYTPFDEGKHYILKGGPGTGKSTLMRKAAEELEKKGYFVEYGYCSADPASLDLIYAPEINFTIFDGTSPHTFDPTLPGVTEYVVNLGEAWDKKYLKEHRTEIGELVKSCGEQHKKSAEYLWVASRIEAESARIFNAVSDKDKIFNYADRLAKRKIPDKNVTGKSRLYKRFLSGITPDGVVVQYDTLNALCESIITIEDGYSSISPVIMRFLRDYALDKGYDVIECLCPLLPFSKTEHIIIPELKICFFTQNGYHYSLSGDEKTVHTSRFVDKSALSSVKEKLAFSSKSKKELINEAVRKNSVAKGLHDKLEAYYIKATDFSVVEEKYEGIIREL